MEDIKKLEEIAKNTRIDIVNMIHNSKSGHLGRKPFMCRNTCSTISWNNGFKC